MDYYAIINGQKKGPFDTISIIKMIRSGEIKPDTQFSDSYNGEFVSANSFPVIAEIFHNQEMAKPKNADYFHNSLSLSGALKDGVDLWSRYALSFTIISGMILATAFALIKGLSSFPALADYPFIANFFVSLITAVFYLNFFSFILFAKRSQALDITKYSAKMKAALGANIFFAAILAIFTTANAVNPLIGIVAMIGFLIFATLAAFVPFIVYDKKISFLGAFAQSSKKVIHGGADTIGVVLAIVALNIVVAILPAIFFPKLFIFGLFISLPITVSALAYIYDEIFG
jgi:hypothetical protein